MQPEAITGLILAGGAGSRMGGIDKGLARFRGTRLVDHAMARLRPQVSGVIISANRNLPEYRALGVPVVTDGRSDLAGPLAGVAAALRECPTPWLVTVPCDVPDFPADLVARLAQAVQSAASGSGAAGPARLALACVGTAGPGPHPELHPVPQHPRLEPAFMLVHRDLGADMSQALDQSLHAVRAWAARVGYATALFTDARAFANANTAQELHDLE